MKPHTLTALAAACLLALPALAQTVQKETTVSQTQNPVTGTTTQTTTTKTTEFVDLDVDHDGYLIVSEAAKNPEFSKVWVEYDKDGDKRITRVEYDAYRTIAVKQPVASTTTTTTTTRRQFVDFDTDADGYIVVNDLPRDEPFVKVWTTYDKDGDKRIARVEYDTYLSTLDAPATASTSTTTTTTTTTRREFVALDANADGFLVVDEIPKENEFAKVYVEYDKDGDRKITRTEYDAWYTVEVDED